jgi:RNA polymerase sigma-70 factor (ECF subfamily)
MLESLPAIPASLNDEPSYRLMSRFDRAPVSAREVVAKPNDDQIAWMLAVGRDRDRTAYAALFNHFAPRVKSFMRKGGMSGELAEDIAQETMVQVWRKAHTFDPERAAVSTWIFRIARNKRIDRLRSEGRPTIEEEAYRVELGEQAEPSDPLEAAALEQTSRRIRDLVADLPADQLKVIEKAFFEDKPHGEVAQELGLPLGTVKSRIRLALARLRKALPDEE